MNSELLFLMEMIYDSSYCFQISYVTRYCITPSKTVAQNIQSCKLRLTYIHLENFNKLSNLCSISVLMLYETLQ